MTQRAIDGKFIYFVTTNVNHGRWFFTMPERAAVLGQAIQTCCRMKKFDLIGYCILPNHIHLLVRKPSAEERGMPGFAFTPHRALESARCGEEEKAWSKESWEATHTFLFPNRRLSSRRSFQAPESFVLGDLMKSIKGSFSRTLPKGKFWHRRFNFRIITSDEYLRNVLSYIEYNYRKMNLPEKYGQPPFVFFDQEAIAKLLG